MKNKFILNVSSFLGLVILYLIPILFFFSILTSGEKYTPNFFDKNPAITFLLNFGLFYLSRIVIRPIYRFKKYLIRYNNNEISDFEFNKYWLKSRNSAIIVSLLIFTIPFLIPHFYCLKESRIG